MSIEKIIDLRERPRGCVQHPLVRLERATDELKEGDTIIVITNEKIIPLETIKVIAKRKNLALEVLETSSDNKLIKVVLKKT